VTAAYRCSRASVELAEPTLGTASTVRAFLLLEAAGGWGVDAVTGSRLPPEVRGWLRGLERAHRVRPLIVRGHGRQRSGRTRVFAASVHGDAPWVETAVLTDPREVVDLPVEGLASGVSAGLTSYDEPLFCVCTHGKHDACCAERGRPLCKALHDFDPEHTWEVSHIGGDRFAPNVLVLPHGLYYGRLDPSGAAEFVETVQRGELDLEHLRGRCAFSFPVQAAEIYLRRELDLRDASALTLVRQERAGVTVRVRFVVGRSALPADGAHRYAGDAPGGEAWDVELRSEPGEARQLTCRATVLGAGLRHTLTAIAPVRD
jgi:hypothetical protein